MPMRKELYPKNWKEIAFDTHKRTLTVSHLNHIPQDIREENLKAMCAPCHLRYDAKHHAESRLAKREQEQNHD